jgi:hypothetical protein
MEFTYEMPGERSGSQTHIATTETFRFAGGGKADRVSRTRIGDSSRHFIKSKRIIVTGQRLAPAIG